MDVSIIIVAWNVRELLYNCIKSIYEQTQGVKFEVIYVDNASKDGSVEMVVKEFPNVRVLKNRENKGFVAANNQGCEIAQGRYVLLLNSDTIILDDAIAETVKFADENPEAAAVGCKVLNPDGTLQRNCFMYYSHLNMLLLLLGFSKIFAKNKFFGRSRMTWWDFNDVREVEVIVGCYLLVRKHAIEQIGLMDEQYFMYSDELDWCYRFNKNGWKLMYTPYPKIIHYGGQTTKQAEARFLHQLYGSLMLFVRKHRSKPDFQITRFLTAMYFFSRAALWFAKSLFYHKNLRENALQSARSHVIGGFYCIGGWENLLMNKEIIQGQ